MLNIVVLSTDYLNSIANLEEWSIQLDIDKIAQIYQILTFELITSFWFILTLQFVMGEYQIIINHTKRQFGITIFHSSLLAKATIFEHHQ